ncbi:MAG: hypothetical protein R2754_15900 [Microthrixaceae bacterium]
MSALVGLAVATSGAAGVALLADPLLGSPLARAWRVEPAAIGDTLRKRLNQAGLSDVSVAQLGGLSMGAMAAGITLGLVLLGAVVPALALGVVGLTTPVGLMRRRRRRQLEEAREAWPAMIEEIRLLCASVGRSIPQALFEVGQRAPAELRPAFEAAHREWLLTRDLTATTELLRDLLADPTADATCETLLIAHQLGGADLDRRLAALAEDRRQDLLDRKDARSRQAGVRFARRFVLLVPLGMALVGLSIGDGREAYQSTLGQLLALAAVSVLAACWAWSGRILKLPNEQRVFGS